MERAFGTELVIFGAVITVLWSITVLLATAWARTSCVSWRASMNNRRRSAAPGASGNQCRIQRQA
ncbi:MAG: hypothetical protein IPG71_14280 [bacterium]|nr:hypothetical protein [bacterium]